MIRAFGVLNPLFEDARLTNRAITGRNIPFPGQFLLDAEHVVVAKAFTGDLRHRASGTLLVQHRFGADPSDPSVELVTDELRATISLSSRSVFGGQEVGVLAVVTIAPGWYCYGAPAGASYTPLSIVFDDPLIVDQVLDLPAATRIEGGEEELFAHRGELRAVGRIRIAWNPVSVSAGNDHDRAPAIPTGERRLRGRLEYQACDGQTCLPPRRIPFELPLDIRPNLAYRLPDS